MQEAKKSFILSVVDWRGERCGVTSAAWKGMSLLACEIWEDLVCCMLLGSQSACLERLDSYGKTSRC